MNDLLDTMLKTQMRANLPLNRDNLAQQIQQIQTNKKYPIIKKPNHYSKVFERPSSFWIFLVEVLHECPIWNKVFHFSLP